MKIWLRLGRLSGVADMPGWLRTGVSDWWGQRPASVKIAYTVPMVLPAATRYHEVVLEELQTIDVDGSTLWQGFWSLPRVNDTLNAPSHKYGRQCSICRGSSIT